MGANRDHSLPDNVWWVGFWNLILVNKMNKKIIRIMITTLIVGAIGNATSYLIGLILEDFHNNQARRTMRIGSRRKEQDLTAIPLVIQ